MRIAVARLTPFALPLRAPLVTARWAMTVRRGVLVALECPDGALGFGEATPVFEDAEGALQRVLEDASALCAALLASGRAERPRGAAPAARFAVETALLDLESRARGVPLAEHLAGGPAPRRAVRVNALLAQVEPEALAAKARAACARGFRTVKLKVGLGPSPWERARLAAVREAVGEEVDLRVDANGAWSPEHAIERLARLDDLGLELVEQPVAAGDLEGLARVRAASRVPVAADEAVADERSAERVIERRAADLVVLKPGVLGGLATSLELARRARASGLGVFVTSGLDGAIARAAALALAAALPDPLPACGLATGGLLAADLASCVEPKDGAVELSPAPGLGVTPDGRALASLALGPTRELRAP